MSTLHVVVIMISQATGSVEALSASNAWPADTCPSILNLTRQFMEETPGYKTQATCATREVLEEAIATNNCHLVDQSGEPGLVTNSYACEKQDWMNKLRSLWK